MKRMSGLVNSKFPLPGLRKGGCPTLIPLLRFTELVDKQCGAGFSLRGTSVPLERRTGTCGRQAEDPPQAEPAPRLVTVFCEPHQGCTSPPDPAVDRRQSRGWGHP